MNTEGVSPQTHHNITSTDPPLSVAALCSIVDRLAAKPWIERVLVWPDLQTECAYWNRSLVIHPRLLESLRIDTGYNDVWALASLPVVMLPEDDEVLARDLAIAQRTALLARVTGWAP